MWKNRDEIRFVAWQDDPEPNRNDLPGTVVLDAGVYEYTYLYDTTRDRTAWLQFEGELSDIEQ